mgnify:CR=1 FL=1
MILGIVILSLLAVPMGAAATAHIARFIFITETQEIGVGEISGPITLQAQDSGGNPAKAGTTLCLGLSSVPQAGEFSSNKDNWEPINTLTINSNWTSRTFYYKSPVIGTRKMDAKIAVKPEGATCSAWSPEEWVVLWNASQDIVIVSGGSDSGGGGVAPALVNPPVTALPSVPPRELRAYAGEDREAAAGSWVSFLGQAIGFDGKPLENARFWWNFGDGGTHEGRSTGHIYRFPGKYTAGLHISSGSSAASDYAVVTVIPNKLALSNVLQGENGFLRLKNGSGIEVDIGGWKIEDGVGAGFVVPPQTKVGGDAELALPNVLTGLLKRGLTPLTVYYPDGQIALRWSVPGVSSTAPLNSNSVRPPPPVVQHPTFQTSLDSVEEYKEEYPREAAAVAQSSTPAALFFILAAALLGVAAAAGFLIIKWKSQRF